MYFPIKFKILSGFTVVLLLMSLSGVLSITALQVIQTSMRETLDNEISVREHANFIAQLFLQARKNETDFFLRLDPQLIQVTQSSLTQIDAKIDTIALLYKDRQRSAEQLLELRNAIDEYWLGFKNVSDKMAQRGYDYTQGIRKDLLSVSQEIEDLILDASNHPQSLLLQITILKEKEEKFFIFHDFDSIAQLQDQITKIKTTISGLESDLPNYQDILRKLDKYKQTLDKLITADDEIMEGTEHFQMAADQVPVLLSSIVRDANKNMEQRMQESQSYENLVGNLIIVGIIVAIFSGLAIGWYVASLIVSPVKKVTSIATDISKGELSSGEVATESNDETRDLTKSLSLMQRSLQSIITNIRSSSNRIMSFSSRVNSTSKQVAETAIRLDREVRNQSINLESVNQTIRRMDKSVNEVALIAAEGAEASQLAQAETLRGNELMGQMQQEIEEIANNTEEIHTSVRLIHEIAAHTAILALNASVEAVKAGAFGKGFGVVALEVQRLAELSSKSAQQITELADRSQKTVADGVNITNAVTHSFQTIDEIVEQMANHSEAISKATQQQTEDSRTIVNTIHEISLGMDNTNKDAQGLSKSAAEQSSDLTDLSKMALETLQMITIFKIKSDPST